MGAFVVLLLDLLLHPVHQGFVQDEVPFDVHLEGKGFYFCGGEGGGFSYFCRVLARWAGSGATKQK